VNHESVPAWPNQAEAALILGVHQATLLRIKIKLPVVQAGKEKRIAPIGVLAAARHFRRRPLREVASALIELAQSKYLPQAEAVAAEVDGFLVLEAKASRESADEMLRNLEDTLPRPLYRGIDATYRRSEDPAPSGRKGQKAPADKSRRASNARA